MTDDYVCISRFRYLVDLYLEYSKMSLRALFAFRIDALLRTLAVFVRESSAVVVVLLILQSFSTLGGWTTPELLLLFSLLFLSYGVLISFFTGFRDFEEIVHTGELDRFLLRPHGLMFQLVASRADYLASIGQGAVGVVLFSWACIETHMTWTTTKIVFMTISMISGVLIQGAIFVFFSALNLYMVRSGNILGEVYYSLRKFAVYPLSVFPLILQGALVFLVPFAFVNYFPAKFLLDKTIDDGWPDWMAWIGVLVGFLMFLGASRFWHGSLRRYTSSGH